MGSVERVECVGSWQVLRDDGWSDRMKTSAGWCVMYNILPRNIDLARRHSPPLLENH